MAESSRQNACCQWIDQSLVLCLYENKSHMVMLEGLILKVDTLSDYLFPTATMRSVLM